MALLEAALSLAAAARPSSLSVSFSSRFSLLCSQLGRNSKRALSNLAGPSSVGDVEDSGRLGLVSPKKKCKVPETFLSRFRRRKGLYVTDVTATEWCEKQMEFILLFGKPESTPAMKAGSMRHAKLEEEVIKKVEVHVESLEDMWALKFMNFIICANQLLFEGLTREVPVVGLVQGVWMVGVIDELRMPIAGEDRNLMLVDTKTRVRPRLPTEPQGRNGRLQLMCYKYLWDNLVSENFPSAQFFEYFSLDSRCILSDEIKRLMVDSDFSAETLGDVVGYFSNFCSVLPRAHDQLLLRYELQEDNSLIGEDEFTYDDNWLKAQIQSSLEFWQGEREARFTPEKEQWKCRYCQFASVCPSQTDANSQTSSL